MTAIMLVLRSALFFVLRGGLRRAGSLSSNAIIDKDDPLIIGGDPDLAKIT